MTIEQWLMLGALIGTWIGAGISVYNARASRQQLEAQTQHEKASTTNEDAKASESYANASAIMAEQYTKVRQELDQLKAALDERDKIILGLTRNNSDLKNWAERLVHQLQSLDVKPVPFRGSQD